MWEGVGAQRKRPHKPNHSGGPHAEVTPAGLMRLIAGMATRGSVLGQRYGITHALKLVAKCKAWCGCMSSTGEMKTRTAPAQIVQPLACWPERLAERLVCVSIVHLRCCPPQTPNGCNNTVRGPAELALSPAVGRAAVEARPRVEVKSSVLVLHGRPFVCRSTTEACWPQSYHPILPLPTYSAVHPAGDRSAYPPNR